jgi:hypothetical protein
MADKTFQMQQFTSPTATDNLFPNIKPLNIPADTIVGGSNIGITRGTDGVITINGTASAVDVSGKADKTGIDTTAIELSNNTSRLWYLNRYISGGTLSGGYLITLTNCTIYKAVTNTITLSGAGVLRLVNCTIEGGNIAISGAGTLIIDSCHTDNTGAKITYSSTTNGKVYISNSPTLAVGGVTSSNWQNVFIDGVAAYKYGEHYVQRFANGTQIITGWKSAGSTTFAVAFVGDPPTVAVGNTDSPAQICSCSVQTVTAITFVGAGGAFIAIGRWKT